MNRRIINLAAAAVTFVGAGILAKPVQATTAFDCTEEQWQAGQDAANEVCQGASFSISCRNNIVVVTILACPPGNG
jgi:hypothetical protein